MRSSTLRCPGLTSVSCDQATVVGTEMVRAFKKATVLRPPISVYAVAMRCPVLIWRLPLPGTRPTAQYAHRSQILGSGSEGQGTCPRARYRLPGADIADAATRTSWFSRGLRQTSSIPSIVLCTISGTYGRNYTTRDIAKFGIVLERRFHRLKMPKVWCFSFALKCSVLNAFDSTTRSWLQKRKTRR